MLRPPTCSGSKCGGWRGGKQDHASLSSLLQQQKRGGVDPSLHGQKQGSAHLAEDHAVAEALHERGDTWRDKAARRTVSPALHSRIRVRYHKPATFNRSAVRSLLLHIAADIPSISEL